MHNFQSSEEKWVGASFGILPKVFGTLATSVLEEKINVDHPPPPSAKLMASPLTWAISQLEKNNSCPLEHPGYKIVVETTKIVCRGTKSLDLRNWKLVSKSFENEKCTNTNDKMAKDLQNTKQKHRKKNNNQKKQNFTKTNHEHMNTKKQFNRDPKVTNCSNSMKLQKLI